MRKLVPMATLAATAVIVAGCQRVDTDLVIDESLSGERVMTVEISDSRLESDVSMTPAELDAIAADNLPAPLDYAPLTAVDGGYRATFTLAFTSLDDYVTKVGTVLEAGLIDTDPEVIVEVLDSPFSSGVQVEENFNSAELLQWLDDALAQAGVLASAPDGALFDVGTNVVTFAGETIEAGGSRIAVNTAETLGMSGVATTTTYEGEDQWSRTIVATMDTNTYRKLGPKADDYFTEHLPDGAELESTRDGDQRVWTVQIPAGSTADIVAATNEVLLSEDTDFEVEVAPSAEVPALEITVDDSFNCAQICDSYASTSSTLLVPDSWSLQPSSAGYTSDESPVGTTAITSYQGVVELRQFVPLASIDVDTVLLSGGATEMVFTYRVAQDVAVQFGELLTGVFAPDFEEAELSVNEGDEHWEYVVALRGEDGPALSDLLNQYLPGSSFTRTDTPGWFKSRFVGQQVINLSSAVGSAPLDGEVTYTVEAPTFHSFDDQDETYGFYSEPIVVSTIDPVTIEFAGSGMAISGLVSLAVLALLVIAAIVLAIIFRDKLRAGAASLRAASASGAPNAGANDVGLTGVDVAGAESLRQPYPTAAPTSTGPASTEPASTGPISTGPTSTGPAPSAAPAPHPGTSSPTAPPAPGATPPAPLPPTSGHPMAAPQPPAFDPDGGALY